jgi:hypothetical protein
LKREMLNEYSATLTTDGSGDSRNYGGTMKRLLVALALLTGSGGYQRNMVFGMFRKSIVACTLALVLLAGSASAQIIGGGIIGGRNPGYPLRYTPSLWLDSSPQYCFTDAACQFTAADKSWLQITDASQTGLDLGTDDGLICGWIWCDSLTSLRIVFDKRTISAANQGYVLLISTAGAVTARLIDTSTAEATSANGVITTGKWIFLAYHADRSDKLRAWCGDTTTTPVVVCEVDISDKVSSNINGDGALVVGNGYTGANPFDGRQDSLMLFKAADLSPVASDIIAWAYNAGAGRLCSEITTAQKTAWGAISGWELGENSGRRYDSWGPNHLDQAFAELVTNGTFTGNSTGWNEGVGWAYGTNNEAATAAEADLAQTTVAPTVGKLYSTSFTAAVTSGTLRLNLGGVNGTTRSTSATHTETMRATSTASLVIDPVAAFTGTVDAVSVMAAEILPAPGIVRGLCVDGDDLSYWVDRSGNGRHASIVTLAMRPIYQTNELNSLPILDFDGIDDRLETSLQGLQAATIFAVVKGGADGDGYVGVNDSMLGVAAGPVIAGVVANHTTATVKSNEDPTADYRVVCLSYAGDAAAESLHVDGTQEYAGTQSGAVAVDADTYTIGAVDSGGTIGTFGDCQIAAVIIYPSVLTTGQRGAVTAWLQANYALAP